MQINARQYPKTSKVGNMAFIWSLVINGIKTFTYMYVYQKDAAQLLLFVLLNILNPFPFCIFSLLLFQIYRNTWKQEV
jgi:hypothetical protein